MTGKMKNDYEFNILNRIYDLTGDETYISYSVFDSVVKEQAEGNISIRDLHEALRFISNQYSLWLAKWYFSPAHSPDKIAESEVEGWRFIWQAFSNMLMEYVPDAMELITEEHNLTLVEHSLKSRVEFNETKPMEKLTSQVLGKTAMFLNKIGFKSIANNIYNAALYPKGTVGRVV